MAQLLHCLRVNCTKFDSKRSWKGEVTQRTTKREKKGEKEGKGKNVGSGKGLFE
jgi:hypothetical protein